MMNLYKSGNKTVQICQYYITFSEASLAYKRDISL